MNQYNVKNADIPIALRLSSHKFKEKIYLTASNLTSAQNILKQQFYSGIEQELNIQTARIADTCVIYEPRITISLQSFIEKIECYEVDLPIFFAGIFRDKFNRSYFEILCEPQTQLPCLSITPQGLQPYSGSFAIYKLSEDGKYAKRYISTGSTEQFNEQLNTQNISLSLKQRSDILDSIKSKKIHY